MQVRQRVERLEQRSDSQTDVLILVGEATAEQQALIDAGKIRMAIWIPSNGRGGSGNHQESH